MTQEELRKEIDDLLDEAARVKYSVDWTDELIKLVNKHVKEVIGEDEDGRIGIHTAYYNESATNKEQNARNELRVVQLKRARL